MSVKREKVKCGLCKRWHNHTPQSWKTHYRRHHSNSNYMGGDSKLDSLKKRGFAKKQDEDDEDGE